MQKILTHIACSLLLLELVVFSVAVEATTTPYVVVLHTIDSYSAALELYRDDNGAYPSEVLGLAALLPDEESSNEFARRGYVKRVVKDPWGLDFQYRYPGEHNESGFDLWSNGSDRKVGGDGINADCGNWEESKLRCREEHSVPSSVGNLLYQSGIVAFTGLIIGMPLYLLGIAVRRKSGQALFVGYHLTVLLYLMLIGLFVVLCVELFARYSR